MTSRTQDASVRRVAVASFIGTTIEWYDFFLYGTASALIFNKLFFPNYDPLTGTALTHEACDQLTVLPKTGTLSEEQFDEKVKNLVTFLAYSANPVKLQHQRIGTYVLLYLAFFFVFAYLLKREYWKDVH